MQRRTFITTAAIASLAGSGLVRAQSAQNIAIMIPMSGPGGLFGPSCKACAELAFEVINARGGILGKPITPLFGDAGLPPAEVTQTALKLWKGQKAQAFIGMHDSAVRGALVGLFKGQIPYFYTPVYEGGECAKGTFMGGETPQQQLEPVIPWIAAERKPTKWYMIGNDYIWGRNTNAAAREYITKTGAKIVGDEYLPFTVDNFDASLTRIRESGADAVLVSLVGGASVTFNKAFASMGLSDKIIRLGTLLEENTLAGIGVANAKNLYSSAGYFATVQTPAAKAFSEAYFKKFGPQAPMLSTLGQSVYEGVMMFEAIANRAKSLDVDKMDKASNGASYSGPRGEVTMGARHVTQNIYVATVDDKGFHVVKSFQGVGSGQTCKV